MKTGLSGPDIQHILKHGKRYTDGGITVVCGAKGDPEGRAFIVSKKTAKQSVDRNAIRRRLREASADAPTSCRTFVILCRDAGLSFQSMKKTIHSLLETAE